jgi:hypothetical protein
VNPRKFGQILFVSIVLALAQSVAHADIVGELNSAFHSTCGSTPQQSCAIDFWSAATDAWFDIATGYYNLTNDPGFPAWCTLFPTECQELLLDWSVSIAATDYCLAQLEYWQAGGL